MQMASTLEWAHSQGAHMLYAEVLEESIINYIETDLIF